MMMRVISNYATVGRDGSAQAMYRLNRPVSRGARQLLDNLPDFAQWTGKKSLHERPVTNEHRLPAEPLAIHSQQPPHDHRRRRLA